MKETTGPGVEEISILLRGWASIELSHAVDEAEQTTRAKQLLPWCFSKQGCFLAQLKSKRNLFTELRGRKACVFEVEKQFRSCEVKVNGGEFEEQVKKYWIKVNGAEEKINSSEWDQKILLHKLLFRMMNVNEGRKHIEDSQLTEEEAASLFPFSFQSTSMDSEDRFADSAAQIIDTIRAAASRSGTPGIFLDCVFRTDDYWNVTVYYDGTSFTALKFGCKNEVFLLVFSSVANKREPVRRRSDAIGSDTVNGSIASSYGVPIFGSCKERSGRRSRSSSDSSGYASLISSPDRGISMEQLMEESREGKAILDSLMIRCASASNEKANMMGMEAARRRVLEKQKIKDTLSTRSLADKKD
ncbi:hypothetical protein [Spongorhabdus nitratireducens]